MVQLKADILHTKEASKRPVKLSHSAVTLKSITLKLLRHSRELKLLLQPCPQGLQQIYGCFQTTQKQLNGYQETPQARYNGPSTSLKRLHISGLYVQDQGTQYLAKSESAEYLVTSMSLVIRLLTKLLKRELTSHVPQRLSVHQLL